MLSLASLLSVAAVCVSKGGDIDFVEQAFAVTDDLTVTILSSRADIELFHGEPGVLRTQGELGNRNKVIHRVQPGVFSPSSHVVVEAFIPVQYAPRARATVRLWVPDGARVEVDGEDSSVTIEGPLEVGGRITLTQGDAVLTDVTGDFEIETGAGGITVNRGEGRFNAETGRGSIFLRGAPTAGAVSRMATGAGSIFADLSRAPGLPVLARADRGAILLHDGGDPISGAGISVEPDSGRAALELVTANGIIDIRR